MKIPILYKSKNLLIEYNPNVHSCWGSSIQLKEYDETCCYLFRCFALFIYFGNGLPYI